MSYFRVTFLGESAVDDGGPRREFFMLVISSLREQNSLFQGPADRRVLRHNTTALQEKVYLTMGKIIGLSLVHGGPGPKFLAPTVVDYLFGGLNKVQPRLEDIPDMEVQQLMMKA